MEAEKLDILWNKRPLIISGPCSAETEEQLVDTASRIASTGKVDILRAGIWKPRTKPGIFEGVGIKGLPWLVKAKAITGLPVMVEVASARQVEAALSFNTDMLWIGARTTANPFSVQEIADALKGVDIPVFIKNPVSPDIDLWCGAVERITRSGIEKTGLIHRGFSSYGETKYRNAPMWQLVIEMKRRNPGMLFINDPSHICGRRDILAETIQKAIDFGFDGLMIESHIDPAKALSDAEQQVTPGYLAQILDNIIWRQERTLSAEYYSTLETMRRDIDRLDNELLQILSQRMKIAEQIGGCKKANNITILQTNRWQEILDRVISQGVKLELSREFIIKYFDAIHFESINHQKKILDEF